MTFPPLGSKLRTPDGRLFHVRGHVDDRVVLRTWSPVRQGWRYEVESETAFVVGLYKLAPARPKRKDGR